MELVNHIDINTADFSAVKRQKDKIELLKQKIKKKGYETLEIFQGSKKYLTLYLINKNYYSFHFYAIHEPDIDELSGKEGIVAEVYINSRQQEFFIKRNLKEVQFSYRNITGMLKHAKRTELFEFLEHEQMKGVLSESFSLGELLYITQWEREHYRDFQGKYDLAQFFVDYVNKVSRYELLVKLGFNSQEIFRLHNDNLIDYSKTKPHQMFGLSKGAFRTSLHLAEKHNSNKDLMIKGLQIPKMKYGTRIKVGNQEFLLKPNEDYQILKTTYGHEMFLGLEEAFYSKPKEWQEQYIQKHRVNYINLVKHLEAFNDYYGLNINIITQFDFQEYLQVVMFKDIIFPKFYIDGERSEEAINEYSKIIRTRPNIVHTNLTNRITDLAHVHVYSQFDLTRMLKYLLFEIHIEQGITGFNFAMSLLKDYYRMSARMGVPNFEKYPKSLHLAHDIASMNYSVAISEIQRKEWESLAKKQAKKYNYSNKNSELVIIYPEQPEELIKEGSSLNHCVKSYINSVINRATDVVFCRYSEKPEESFYTVEIRNGEIVQVRGKFNQPATNEVKEFIDSYAKEKSLAVAY